MRGKVVGSGERRGEKVEGEGEGGVGGERESLVESRLLISR